MRVYFTPDRQQLINEAATVKIRNVEAIAVYLDLEPVPSNKGFYSVNMTFSFDAASDVYCPPTSGSTQVNGIAVPNKKMIPHGNEGNVKMFGSDCGLDDLEVQSWACRALPRATVQVAEPAALPARVCDCLVNPCEICYRIPDCICRKYDSDFVMGPVHRTAYATTGTSIIVQTVRNVQMLTPAYDFCIPEEECEVTSDDLCELFRRTDFLMDEFLPPKSGDCGCEDRGCRQR